MTEITKTVEKDLMYGVPYKFRCRWFGKYDEEFVGTSPVGINKSENDLTNYDGLSYTKKAVISPNAIMVGNPSPSSDLVVSSFSATKFYQLPTAFNPGSDRWEMYFKVKPGASSSTIAVIFHSCFGSPGSASGRYGIAIGLKSGKMIIDISSNGTSWIISDTSPGSYTYTTGNWYWIKFGRSASEYYVEYSTDGETYTRDLTFSSTDAPYGYLTRSYIGIYSTSNFSNPWTGSIDLSECYIKTASQFFPDTWQTFWESLIHQGTILDFSNTKLPWKWDYTNKIFPLWAVGNKNQTYTFYGNTLNGTTSGIPATSADKIMSNFSGSNYLQLSKKLLPGNGTWKLRLKVKTGNDVSSQHYLFGSSTNYYKTVGCELNAQGKFGVGITSNGSSWDIGWMSGTTVVSPNTWYWIQVSFTGTEYKFELSTDGINWNLEKSIQSSTPIYQSSSDSTMYLGTMGSKATYWQGEIDLKECWFVCDNFGAPSWYGFDKTVLDGCINGDTDSNGEYYCYAINGNERLELQKKTGSMILAYNTTPRYLGEVDTNVYGYYRVGFGDPSTPV